MVRVAADEVNVDQSISIGGIMADEFTSKLPDGFYDPLKKTVIAMEAIKKKMKVGDSSVYDMEKLYARLLIVSRREMWSFPTYSSMNWLQCHLPL